MDRDRLLGLAKLRKGNWRLALDALGHTAIAAGAAGAAVAVVALLKERRAWVYGLVGALAGEGALVLREGIQFATSGSPNILDRLLDAAPGLPVGFAVGLIVCVIVRKLSTKE